MVKYEYKTISCPIDDFYPENTINKFGENGWELIAAVAVPNFVRFYFKRVKQ